uniref:Uncharacterized protein n=1 Tax=Cannabis sativa TaxID=3483 RepID=A0A803PNG7_CANSA
MAIHRVTISVVLLIFLGLVIGTYASRALFHTEEALKGALTDHHAVGLGVGVGVSRGITSGASQDEGSAGATSESVVGESGVGGRYSSNGYRGGPIQ